MRCGNSSESSGWTTEFAPHGMISCMSKFFSSTRPISGLFLGSLLAVTLCGCNQPDSSTLVLPGIVETQEVRLSSKVGGRVEKVLVREGDLVDAGQQLVMLECAELNAKRSQLVAQQESFQAKLDLLCNGPLPEAIAAARSSLEMSEIRLKRLETGARTEEIEIAKYESELWAAEYDRALAEYNRLKTLAAANSISQTELESAKADLLKAKSQASSSAKSHEMLVKGARVEDLDEARSQVAKFRADYDLIKRGARDEEIRQAKAQVAEIVARIAELDAQLAECSIVAPEPCRIEVVAVRHGDMASPNSPVMRVLYDGDLWVKAYIPETQLALVKLNQSVSVTHDGSKQEYEGTISHIANISEFTPRNVQSPDERHNQVFAIKVLLKDNAGVFKSGMAASIRIPLAK